MSLLERTRGDGYTTVLRLDEQEQGRVRLIYRFFADAEIEGDPQVSLTLTRVQAPVQTVEVKDFLQREPRYWMIYEVLEADVTQVAVTVRWTQAGGERVHGPQQGFPPLTLNRLQLLKVADALTFARSSAFTGAAVDVLASAVESEKTLELRASWPREDRARAVGSPERAEARLALMHLAPGPAGLELSVELPPAPSAPAREPLPQDWIELTFREEEEGEPLARSGRIPLPLAGVRRHAAAWDLTLRVFRGRLSAAQLAAAEPDHTSGIRVVDGWRVEELRLRRRDLLLEVDLVHEVTGAKRAAEPLFLRSLRELPASGGPFVPFWNPIDVVSGAAADPPREWRVHQASCGAGDWRPPCPLYHHGAGDEEPAHLPRLLLLDEAGHVQGALTPSDRWRNFAGDVLSLALEPPPEAPPAETFAPLGDGAALAPRELDAWREQVERHRADRSLLRPLEWFAQHMVPHGNVMRFHRLLHRLDVGTRDPSRAPGALGAADRPKVALVDGGASVAPIDLILSQRSVSAFKVHTVDDPVKKYGELTGWGGPVGPKKGDARVRDFLLLPVDAAWASRDLEAFATAYRQVRQDHWCGLFQHWTFFEVLGHVPWGYCLRRFHDDLIGFDPGLFARNVWRWAVASRRGVLPDGFVSPPFRPLGPVRLVDDELDHPPDGERPIPGDIVNFIKNSHFARVEGWADEDGAGPILYTVEGNGAVDIGRESRLPLFTRNWYPTSTPFQELGVSTVVRCDREIKRTPGPGDARVQGFIRTRDVLELPRVRLLALERGAGQDAFATSGPLPAVIGPERFSGRFTLRLRLEGAARAARCALSWAGEHEWPPALAVRATPASVVPRPYGSNPPGGADRSLTVQQLRTHERGGGYELELPASGEVELTVEPPAGLDVVDLVLWGDVQNAIQLFLRRA